MTLLAVQARLLLMNMNLNPALIKKILAGEHKKESCSHQLESYKKDMNITNAYSRTRPDNPCLR